MQLAQSLLLLSSLLRIFGIVIFIFGVLPVMWREAIVVDRLRFLRISIFTATIIYVALSLIGLSTVFTNPHEIQPILDVVRQSAYLNFVSVINSLGGFTISAILYLIYHKEYKE